MTGFKSKKALTDRMAEAQKEGLHKQNEWQLGMDKLQREIDWLRLENDRVHQQNARLRTKLLDLLNLEEVALKAFEESEKKHG